MRSVLAITLVELRRFLADRSNIFFVFIFPLALVFVLGSSFGGEGPQGRVAVAGADGSLRAALVQRLEAAEVQVTVTDAAEMRESVARGRQDAGVLITDAASTAYDQGQDLELQVIAGSQANAQTGVQLVRTAAQGTTLRAGQEAALATTGADRQAIIDALDSASSAARPATLVVQDTAEVSQEFRGLGQFDQGASSQLLLFVFLTTLTGSATLIQARRNGVIRRTMAAPLTAGQTVLGQALGRLVIALFQGGYIVLATRLLFDVSWGNLALIGLVVAVFGLVASGVAMLVGVVVDNEGAASGLSVGAGLILAALGGCMMPLELFPDGLRTIAHLTPHAWAYEAVAEVQRHEASVVDILPQLGVLAVMAAALLAAGAWALRRSLARSM